MPFFSVLIDHLMDKGYVDNELFMVIRCALNSKDQKVDNIISLFTIINPESVYAEVLFQTLEYALQILSTLSVSEQTCSELIGIKTGRATANTAALGLKGLVGTGVTVGLLDVVLGSLT